MEDDSLNYCGERKKRLLLLFSIGILFVIFDMLCFDTPYPSFADKVDYTVEVQFTGQLIQSRSLLESATPNRIEYKGNNSITEFNYREKSYSNQYFYSLYQRHIQYCRFQI